MEVELRVAASAAEAVREAADLLAEAAGRGGHIALSGGSTPRPAYESAARLAPDWSRVEVWWADERCVPPDDERSNYRLVRETLLDRLDRKPAIEHRVLGELSPQEAADAYDVELRGVVFDLALLGIGPDGHTASLFPNDPALDELGRRAVAVPASGRRPRDRHDPAAERVRNGRLPDHRRGKGGCRRAFVRRAARSRDARRTRPVSLGNDDCAARPRSCRSSA